MRKYNVNNSNKGFSLMEILIVIVIIGILATLAVPKYMSITRKAKEAEAKLMLNQVHTLQESYYSENDVYADTIEKLGFEHEKLISDGGKARFRIAIEKGNMESYKATATSIVDFDKDGNFSVWEVDEEGKITNVYPD